MKTAIFSRLPRLLRTHWLKIGLFAAGLPLLALGCSHETAVSPRVSLPLCRSNVAVASSETVPIVARGASNEGEIAPSVAPAAGQAQVKVLPISLDTVFRLAGEQNTQIALARERVNEAFAEKCLADRSWLPNIGFGPRWTRYEGSIQNEDGTITHTSMGALFAGLGVDGRIDLHDAMFQRINAERKIWQQKGELSRVTNENLLDASSTYIDLLTARTGEEVARELAQYQTDLLKKARDLLKVEPGAKVQVESIQAQLMGLHQVSARLHQRGNAASAKLSYLLGLGPNFELVPVDSKLAPFELVDVTPPASDLMARALAYGPGIQEMVSLLSVIQDGYEKSKGPGRFIPTVNFRMDQGFYGGGPGDNMTGDNRWDLMVEARWSLTDLINARDRRWVAESKLQQAQLTYQDLRNKLALGVQESREAILTGREQVQLLDGRIKHEREAYKLSNDRLTEHIPGSSALEVLQTIQSLSLAHLEYMTTLNSYDKAQLRLMMLLGTVDPCQQRVTSQPLPNIPEKAK